MKIQSELITKESNLIGSAKTTVESSFSESLAVKIKGIKTPNPVTDEGVETEAELTELQSGLISDNEGEELASTSELVSETAEKETDSSVLGINLQSLMTAQELLVVKEPIFFKPESELRSNGEVQIFNKDSMVPIEKIPEALQSLVQSESTQKETHERSVFQMPLGFSSEEGTEVMAGTLITQESSSVLEINQKIEKPLINKETFENYQGLTSDSNEVLEVETSEEVDAQGKIPQLSEIEKTPKTDEAMEQLKGSEVKLSEGNLNITSLKHQELSQTLPNSQPLKVNFEENLTRVNHVLSEGVETLTEGQTSTLKLTLQPEKLGQLEVILQMEDGKVTAKFLVENQKVKQLFEQNMPKLEQNLVKQGMEITKMEVVVQKNSQEALNFSGQFSQQQSQQEQRQKMSKQGNHYKLKEAKFEVVEQEVSADSVDILV